MGAVRHFAPRAALRILAPLALCAVALLSLSACRSRALDAPPVVTITRVPPAREGGSDLLMPIQGRVQNARFDQRVVLYARSGPWWIQPFDREPFTTVNPDSSWSNTTHLGTEYAALLVNRDFHPPSKVDTLPPVGDGILAVAVVPGEKGPSESQHILNFSGYEWNVRTVSSNRGGRNNHFDPSNAWVDDKGHLHLRIIKKNNDWTCAELRLSRSLGYGSYRFIVQDISKLPPNIVLSMFTWDDLGTDQNHRELGIEFTRWGDSSSKNAQYVIQPFYIPANAARFVAPAGKLFNSVRWEPGVATFQTYRGASPVPSALVFQHDFTSGIPLPGGETLHLNLYIFGDARGLTDNPTEVVLEKFEFLP